jgi:glutamate:Na+ symporter, ESS family
LRTLTLDMIQTVALAAVVLFIGYGVRRRVGVLDRFNIPAPVVGGFLFSGVALLLRQTGVLAFEFTPTLQTPLMIAFFTTIGLGASFGLLRIGGLQVVLFWALASVLVIAQNAIGVGMATAMGVDPLLGLITGSITMTGGHGTGAAFAATFEERFGFSGAVTLAMAAATFGLVGGGLLGGPVGTRLIRKFGLTPRSAAAMPEPVGLEHASLDAEIDTEPAGEPTTAYKLLAMLTVVLVAMWAGSLVSASIPDRITLPAYIGAMLCAAIIRNTADMTGVLRIDQRTVDDIGTIALSLFLSMALMTLRLWELLELALPMMAILVVQVTFVGLFAMYITYRVMGRDYDAAVMSAGHCGFALGATPNAVANMTSLTERFGAAPRAFLVVPMVGAFFIDFTNSFILTFIFIPLVR